MDAGRLDRAPGRHHVQHFHAPAGFVAVLDGYFPVAVVNKKRLGVDVDRNETADNAHRDPSVIVTLAVWNIDDSTEDDRRVLLADLVCAAWPTLTAQAQ